jgi:hypothetical protein
MGSGQPVMPQRLFERHGKGISVKGFDDKPDGSLRQCPILDVAV